MSQAEKMMRIEVAGNFRRLIDYRELFGELFVSRQGWTCLQMLDDLAGVW